MPYLLLSDDEQDEILAGFLLAQERDKFSHTVNQERYDALLTSLSPGPFLQRIQRLREETNSRLEEVNAIIANTIRQLPTPARLDAAIARLRAKGSI